MVGHRVSTKWRASHGPFGTLAEAASACLAFTFVALAHDIRLAFVSPVVFVLVIFVFAWSDGRVARVLHTPPFLNLGLWSYSIYMTHLFLLGAVSMMGKLINKVVAASGTAVQWSDRIASPGVSDAAMIAFTLLVVAVSSMTYRYIEIPGQALVNRWVKARR